MDEPTGLPELPENHYWEVSQTGWEELHYLAQASRPKFKIGDHRYGVGIVQKYQSIVTGFKKHWWSKPTEKSINHAERVAFGYMPSPLTPDTIRAKAIEVMVEWEADKATKALLGNYPPKKLES